MGAGIIGLFWTCLFHHHGYRNVTVTEINEDRKKIVEGLGLGFNVCYPDLLKEKYSKLEPEVHGFDLIVDATGNPEAIQDAFPWIRRGGRLNVFGCCPKKSTMTINPAEFMLREITVTGTLINPFTYPAAVKLTSAMAEKYLDYQKLGINIYSLDEYEEAFKALQSGKISKAVFKICD